MRVAPLGPGSPATRTRRPAAAVTARVTHTHPRR
ncbi:hypothetical protein HFP72_35310 [Nocardiopsis sp. ARC36]